MGSFHVHQSNRVERLVSVLAAELERPRGGAFEQEAVVVPGRGMGVWLSMELSKRLGVWATKLHYPRALVEDVARRVLGQHALGAEPLSEELIEAAIRTLLPGLLGEPDFAGLARYLEQDPHGVRLAELSRRLAGVFDQYLTYRPEWARAWEGGGMVSVGEDDRFQAILFRRVAERLRCRHVGELEPELLARLAEPRTLSLPPRVSVLGVSTLPPLFVRVLVALARHVDVHVYLFAPSPVLETETQADARRPLLAALGQVGVELDQVLSATLAEQGVTAVRHEHFERPRAETLLGALQTSLFDPDSPSLAPPELCADETIAVHACHGPTREVEVLNDQLLALMTRAQDPLRPEEVLVLVSDLETYAPLIEATFRRDASDPRHIPFHVADRGSRRESALCDAFFRVLKLVRARVTGAEVLDLLLLGAVQKRLGIDSAGADRVKSWVADAGVRWGMDAAHRERAGLPPERGANTWRFGIQRLMLGYALPSDGRHDFLGLVGYDEVEGNDSVLLGALAGFVRTLFAWLRDLERPRPLSEWSVTVSALLAFLFDESAETLRQTAGIRRALADLLHAATLAGAEEAVDVAVLASLVERRLDQAGPERGFLSGGVAFSAMVPMRSIPFRVIAVLGMNDGAFPRSPHPVEFDRTKSGDEPRRLGDRAPREDDRYLFLETLCAAREKLIVTFAGRSVRDDRELAPSVCLSELMDALAGPTGSEGSRARRAALTVEHQLQSFSPAYFDGKTPRLFSYAEEHAGGARGLAGLEQKEHSFVAGLSLAERASSIALDELVRFFKSPPAYLLNRRLGIYLDRDDERIRAREPLDLDGLEKWKIGDALITHYLGGVGVETSERLLRGMGTLPLGAWGRVELEERREQAKAIADAAETCRQGAEREAQAISIKLDSGEEITGSVGELFPGGRVKQTFSSPQPKQLVELWIRHLALAAVGRSEPSTLVTREKKGPNIQVLGPVDADTAKAHLGELVALFHAGHSRPLPFLPHVSREYFHAIRVGTKKSGPRRPEDALSAAVSEYDHGESKIEPHAPLAFDQLLPPYDARYPDECRLEDTEFHRLATQIFDPIFAAISEGRL